MGVGGWGGGLETGPTKHWEMDADGHTKIARRRPLLLPVSLSSPNLPPLLTPPLSLICPCPPPLPLPFPVQAPPRSQPPRRLNQIMER